MKVITILIIAALVIFIGYKMIEWIKAGKGMDIFTIIFILVSSIGFIALYKYVEGEPYNA